MSEAKNEYPPAIGSARRVQPCAARCGAYKTRRYRTKHFWSGGDVCVWCHKTKTEVGAAQNAPAHLAGQEEP